MIICGIKLTHDGGIALVETSGDQAKLVVQVDMEKLENNERYAPIPSSDWVARLVELAGVAVSDVDVFAVDGWFEGRAWCSPRIIPAYGTPDVPVAPYEDTPADPGIHRSFPGRLEIGPETVPYESFRHVTDHISAAYYTSPAAERGEDSLVLVWDGGIQPRLYHWRSAQRTATPLATLFPMMGNTYGFFGGALSKFRLSTEGEAAEFPERMIRHNLSTPGKMMAYAGLGETVPEYVDALRSAYHGFMWVSPSDALAFSEKGVAIGAEMGLTDADMISGFQSFVGSMLVESLGRELRLRPDAPASLAMAGGCALNIKWNSAIRNSGIVDEVWVPPFPNDSGAALGAAMSAATVAAGVTRLRWSVYAGLAPQGSVRADGWRRTPCSPRELGRYIHETQQPVTVVTGPAELGPRALGHRSILAPAVRAATKDLLNDIKLREAYRPVAPLCLERYASQIFDPGGRDPYMLFDHRVRPGWEERIPAVVHLDGTARLQTISSADDPVVTEIVEGYFEASGIPVLCNTSANFPGCGFFPDVESAVQWGRVGVVWSDGVLMTREDHAAADAERVLIKEGR